MHAHHFALFVHSPAPYSLADRSIHQVQSVSPYRAFESALVPAVTKVKALVGTLKVVKMLRRKSVKGKENQLDDQEIAAVRACMPSNSRIIFWPYLVISHCVFSIC